MIILRPHCKLAPGNSKACVLWWMAVSLVGKSASPELLRKVTYMAYIHDPQVMKIRTVRAYTVGTFFFVEVRFSQGLLKFCCLG